MRNNNLVKRRQFLQAAGLGTASALFNANATTVSAQVPGSNPDKPNVLVIMTDQHRADLMTCAGRDIVPTPNIDRIAARGIRFTNA